MKKARPDVSDLAGKIYFQFRAKEKTGVEKRFRFRPLSGGYSVKRRFYVGSSPSKRVPDHSKTSRRDGPFSALKTRKKPGIPGFFRTGIILFQYRWQGQKDLNPRHAVLEWMWESAPGSGGRAGVTQFSPQVPERPVLVWCCEVFWQAKAAVKLLLLEGPPPRGRTRIARRGPGQCRRLGRGFRPNPRQLCR